MEEEPEELIDSCLECIEKALKQLESGKEGYRKADIKGLGITNQRESTFVWDKKTGRKLYNIIVWPDTRTTSTVKKLAKQNKHGLDALKRKVKRLSRVNALSVLSFLDFAQTGLPISTYFSGVKLRWLLDNVKEVAEAHDQKRLAFGTVETYLLWKFTGGLEGGIYRTDVTNASRTMFMDINSLEWDQELLDFFGVDRSCLAEIVSNSEVYGKMRCSSALDGIPIAGMIGDQVREPNYSSTTATLTLHSIHSKLHWWETNVSLRARARTLTVLAASCSCTPAPRQS